jgi:hypothetical protein
MQIVQPCMTSLVPSGLAGQQTETLMAILRQVAGAITRLFASDDVGWAAAVRYLK